MAAHSSTPAWEVPWSEGPGRLQSIGLQRVRYKLATKQQHTHTYTGILLSHKKERILAICGNMDGPEGHYAK